MAYLPKKYGVHYFWQVDYYLLYKCFHILLYYYIVLCSTGFLLFIQYCCFHFVFIHILFSLVLLLSPVYCLSGHALALCDVALYINLFRFFDPPYMFSMSTL